MHQSITYPHHTIHTPARMTFAVGAFWARPLLNIGIVPVFGAINLRFPTNP
jgi:hypothetical protein